MSREAAALLAQMESMLRAYSQKFARRFQTVSKDDLLQEGRRAVLEIAERYDPNRGSFSTFCHYRVEGAMLNYAKKQTSRSTATFMSSLALRDEDEEPDTFAISNEPAMDGLVGTLRNRIAAFVTSAELDATVPSAEDMHRDASRTQRVRDIVSALPEHDSKFVDMFYEQGKTLDEIAELTGTSKRTVTRAHLKIKQRLAARLLEPG